MIDENEGPGSIAEADAAMRTPRQPGLDRHGVVAGDNVIALAQIPEPLRSTLTRDQIAAGAEIIMLHRSGVMEFEDDGDLAEAIYRAIVNPRPLDEPPQAA